MFHVLLFVHVIVALAVIALILLQQGKGADMGSAFGSGASQTVFGATGSSNFFSRATAMLITTFFITSLFLGYLAAKQSQPKTLTDILQDTGTSQSETVPGDIPKVPE